MTLNNYLIALKALDLKWCSRETAETLGLSVRQLIRISNGHSPVPEPVARLLACLLSARR